MVFQPVSGERIDFRYVGTQLQPPTPTATPKTRSQTVIYTSGPGKALENSFGRNFNHEVSRETYAFNVKENLRRTGVQEIRIANGVKP